MSKNDYRITVIADDRECKNNVLKFLSDRFLVEIDEKWKGMDYYGKDWF